MEKFMAFKFPARRHLGFYDVLWLPFLFGSFQTIVGAVMRHRNPKWRRDGNLKAMNFSIYCYY